MVSLFIFYLDFKNNGNVFFFFVELGLGFDGFSCCFFYIYNGDVIVIIFA